MPCISQSFSQSCCLKQFRVRVELDSVGASTSVGCQLITNCCEVAFCPYASLWTFRALISSMFRAEDIMCMIFSAYKNLHNFFRSELLTGSGTKKEFRNHDILHQLTQHEPWASFCKPRFIRRIAATNCVLGKFIKLLPIR